MPLQPLFSPARSCAGPSRLVSHYCSFVFGLVADSVPGSVFDLVSGLVPGLVSPLVSSSVPGLVSPLVSVWVPGWALVLEQSHE